MSKTLHLFDKTPFLRTPYNYDTNVVSDETGLFCPEPSLTKQEFTQQCDPNYILDRFASGQDIEFNTKTPRYGDFTGVPVSYHEALNFIKNAEQAFMELEAPLRAKFQNDPAQFLAFVEDPANAEQLIELGLATPSLEAVQTLAASSTNSPGALEEDAPKARKGPKNTPPKGGSDSPSE